MTLLILAGWATPDHPQAIHLMHSENIGLVGHFRIMARHNRWSNYRIYRACQQLSPVEFAGSRVGFFPSLLLTLNHILVVDWYYLDALEGGGLGQGIFQNETPYDTCQALAEAQAQTDQRLIHFCDHLTPQDLAQPIAFDRGQRGILWDRVDRTLSHLLVHQIHHRGQAHAMLSSTEVSPPQLDEFLMAGDAHLRAEDLRELGIQEVDIIPQ
ncbi:MAG: DinB family protein [Cyanobacteriota bacterium]|nr:DinB family protein [Cyanobacteriota bacterium]